MISATRTSLLPEAGKNACLSVYQPREIPLLKSIVKKVIERKNELSGEVAKEFETIENLYLYVNGEMRRFKKDKEFVLSAMTDKLPAVNQFITDNKTSFKNIDQVVRLLNFYNGL